MVTGSGKQIQGSQDICMYKSKGVGYGPVHVGLCRQVDNLIKMVFFKKAITPEISEVISGNNSARILFDKVPNASEYLVSYVNDKGEDVVSEKTITDFVDIEGLTNGKTYSFKLIAINDKGESNPSEAKQIIPNGKPLPPIIWDAFIGDNKLVVG